MISIVDVKLFFEEFRKRKRGFSISFFELRKLFYLF